jgi:hypothetical protein
LDFAVVVVFGFAAVLGAAGFVVLAATLVGFAAVLRPLPVPFEALPTRTPSSHSAASS